MTSESPATKFTTVVMDLHGLLIEHRRAKWRFFLDRHGIEFSSWKLDRPRLLEELRDHGKDWAFYELEIGAFLNSEYMKEAEEVEGARNFLERTPRDWSVHIVTGPYMSAERVHEHLSRLALPRIRAATRAVDQERANVVVSLGARIYFDDKSSHFKSIRSRDVTCVQVCDPRYGKVDQEALHYDNWMEAAADLEKLDALAKSPR